ncbi:MAG TPA: serine/threonine-protein kinase [Pirellulales bacterium]
MAEFAGMATRRAPDAAPPVNLGATDASSPESRTARRFASLWVSGQRIGAEAFLATLAGAEGDEKLAVRVIYEEICLRQDQGETVDSQEYFARFPQWREQLGLLFECQGLLEFGEPRYPRIGEHYEEFLLQSEIGRGGQGRVFLATEPDLADRQVVLKITPQHGAEHLSLARVLHTNIVPLYFARDDRERNIRVFCMPFLGRMSLAHLLGALKDLPAPERNGATVARLLETSGPTSGPRSTAERRILEHSSYVEAICRWGAAIADALQYVHDRGLVHLDVKPSNVLLTADCVPMLLDFHLTREPVAADSPPPEWFGGTPDYMSPEQKAALDAVRSRKPLRYGVGARADVFSLGQVLYESFVGVHAEDVPGEDLPPLHLVAPGVSVGLSDVIAKCLRADPTERYQTAGAVASDLRRHLTNLPLLHVGNRSLAERWSKWRKRSPAALSVGGLAGLALAAALAAGAVGWRHMQVQHAEAHQALAAGDRLVGQGRFDEAADEYARGRRLVGAALGAGETASALAAREERARRRQQVAALHSLVDRLRFIYGQETIAPAVRADLDSRCRLAWQSRSSLSAAAADDPSLAEAIKADMLDLAVLWAHTVARSKSPSDLAHADEILSEAETTLGAGLVLGLEHDLLRITRLDPVGRTTGDSRAAVSARALAAANGRDPTLTSWDYQAVGRCLVRLGQLGAAARCFQLAVERAPGDFWANFFQADAAWRRGDVNEALNGLRVCLALAPDKAVCYYNRGLVYAARKSWDLARKDFDRAIQLDPQLGPALLERGRAEHALGRRDAALADFERALKNGADPAPVYTAEAEVHLAQHDRSAAARAARRALERSADYGPALELQQRIGRP